MTLQPAPTVATWFLRMFCSGPEHESAIGDLLEQYQHNRGRFWYWRQVFNMAWRALYGKAMRRPLIRKNGGSMENGFVLVLAIAALVTVLMSDIWPLGLFGIIGGIVVAFLKFERGSDRSGSSPINAPGIARIDSSKIPINGGIGAGLAILTLLGAALIELPELRGMAIPGILGGVLLAIVLHSWRRFHPRDTAKEWLSIKSK